MRGNMLWFNDAKDLGQLRTHEGEHVSVHGAHFAPGARPTGPCGGTVVDFELVEDETGRRAEHVTLVPVAVGGRARQRRTSRALR
jgi:cold shock CspA family protein